MAQEQLEPARHAQLTTLREAYRSSAATGQLVTVSGPAGIGRTTLLSHFARELRAQNVLVITAKAVAESRGHIDVFGLALLISALREHFEQFGDGQVAGLLSALSDTRTTTANSGSDWTPRMAVGLGATFSHIGRLRRTALLVDDVHLIPEPAVALAAARRPGCLVVAGHADQAEPTPGSTELLALADLTVPLPPIPDNEIAAMVARTAGIPLDEGVLTTLRAALGPMCGHPGTVLSILDDLAADGRLVTVAGRLCLRAPVAAIALPARHELCRRAEHLGDIGTRVVATVAVFDGIAIDDLPRLAEVVGAELAECGHTVDRLISRGVLVIDQTGRLRCRCPALASAALRSAPDATPSGLPAMAADVLLRLLGENGNGRQAETGGGGATRADWLVSRAQVTTAAEPEHAVRYYLAALALIGPSAAEPALRAVLPLLVRTGHLEQLAELVDKAATELPVSASLRAELAFAARFSTVHTGRQLSGPALRALFGVTSSDDADRPDCAAWWFADDAETSGDGVTGSNLMSAAEIQLVRAAARGDRESCARWYSAVAPFDTRPPDLAQLLAAGELGDLATVCQLVLGSRYRVPVTGLLASHQRVLRRYADGDFSGALSAARELELGHPGATIVHQLARLLAAEICGARGKVDAARTWLACESPDPRLAALRGWVDAGLRQQAAEPGKAANHAWQTYLRVRDDARPRGIESLLVRTAELATIAADVDTSAALAREVSRWPRHDLHPRRTEAVALVRALVERDALAAQAALQGAVQRGHRPDEFAALLAMARVAVDPTPYLERARQIAERCDCATFDERARTVGWERGVSSQRRERQQTLSPAEIGIVDLISAGLTNRQIASAMAMSEKAVENQLTRLFALTGCRSRIELATAWVEGRLEPAS